MGQRSRAGFSEGRCRCPAAAAGGGGGGLGGARRPQYSYMRCDAREEARWGSGVPLQSRVHPAPRWLWRPAAPARLPLLLQLTDDCCCWLARGKQQQCQEELQGARHGC